MRTASQSRLAMCGSRYCMAICASACDATNGECSGAATLPFGIMRVARRHHAAARHHEARRRSGDAGCIACTERCRGKSQVTGMPATRVVRVIRRQCD